jgi:hypothetical protein
MKKGRKEGRKEWKKKEINTTGSKEIALKAYTFD